MVEELLSFVSQLDAERIHIIGYSMGGYLATKLIAKNSKNICSLFTLGTKWKWNEEIAEQECKKLNPSRIIEKVPKYASYLESLHGSHWPQVVNATQKIISEIGNNPISAEVLSQIHLPVFLALGDNDLLVTSEETAQTQNKIQGSRMQIISNLPHRFEDGDMRELVSTWFSFASSVECPAL